jgi:transcription elongation factor GreA
MKIMSKLTYYTEEGLKKLKDELHELKTKGRADMSRQIAEARDKGDLSENAEYDAAKDAQGLLELKISKLEELLSNARLIDMSSLDTSSVSILSKVKLKNKKTNAVVEYMLVAEEEADLKLGKISVKSPIGKGLLGKKLGEIATIEIPAGKLELEVLDISL